MGRVFGGVYVSVGLFVCLFVFPHDISKINAARIAKLDVDMVHHESWKPIYFEIKSSKVNVTKHKNIAGVVHGALVSAGFF